MTLKTNLPVTLGVVIKYAESARPINYGVWGGRPSSDLYFLRLPNEDAYEISFTFKLTAAAAQLMVEEVQRNLDEIKLK